MPPVVILNNQLRPPVIRPLYGAGARGLTGPAGPPGGAAFEFEQPTPVSSVVINHNLGRRVATTVSTLGGVKLVCEIQDLNTNQVQVSFRTPQAFVAVIA